MSQGLATHCKQLPIIFAPRAMVRSIGTNIIIGRNRYIKRVGVAGSTVGKSACLTLARVEGPGYEVPCCIPTYRPYVSQVCSDLSKNWEQNCSSDHSLDSKGQLFHLTVPGLDEWLALQFLIKLRTPLNLKSGLGHTCMYVQLMLRGDINFTKYVLRNKN